MDSKVGYLLVGLLTVAAFMGGSLWTKFLVSDRKQPEVQVAEGQVPPSPVAVLGEEKEQLPQTAGNFWVTERRVCKENNRPLVYFFGHSGCPHCSWEEPIFSSVAEQFGENIVFNNNMDKREDEEVLESYKDINPGYVPFLVIGCKYVRTGSGEADGEETERDNLTALICKLTNGEPKEICEKEEIKAIQVD